MDEMPPGARLAVMPVDQDRDCAGVQLPEGPLIPAVLAPLVRTWTHTSVEISDGFGRTRTIETGACMDVTTVWDPAPPWGTVQVIWVWGPLRVDGAMYCCPGWCGTHDGPWSVEWVAGDIAWTAALECRSCGHRDRTLAAAAVAEHLAEGPQ